VEQDWPAQNHHLNAIQDLWDNLERRPYLRGLVADLMNAAVAESKKFPAAMFQIT